MYAFIILLKNFGINVRMLVGWIICTSRMQLYTVLSILVLHASYEHSHPVYYYLSNSHYNLFINMNKIMQSSVTVW